MPIYGSAPMTPIRTPKRKRSTGGNKASGGQIADREIAATFVPVKKTLIKGSKKLKKGTGKKLKKLSPEFTKAVKQVFDSKQLYGRSYVHVSGGWDINIAPNSQGFQHLGTIMKDGYGACYFTPFEIVAHAKWMFGDDTVPPPRITVKTLPIDAGVGTGGASSGFECTIKNSYLKVNMMNNTSRTFTVDVYDAAPKIRGQAVGFSFDPANGAVSSNSILALPLVQWGQKLNDAQNNDLVNNEYVREDYNNSPLEIPFMKKEWDFNMQRIIIGPGQKENFYIQGPKNYTFKWASQFKNQQFCDLDKFVKCPFIIMRCENLTSSFDNAQHGIPGYTITTGEPPLDPKLEFLSELHYTMQMPEQTLGKITGIGETAATRRRGPVLRKIQYYDNTVGNDGITTLPENPLQDKIQD